MVKYYIHGNSIAGATHSTVCIHGENKVYVCTTDKI